MTASDRDCRRGGHATSGLIDGQPSGPSEASPLPLREAGGVLHHDVLLINPRATYAAEIAQKCFPPCRSCTWRPLCGVPA